ncbi:MAG: hypothetical protein H7A25_02255 [Leptospiraceae bacterium]|nr:hypothetical protein [Leptospiraceae bacterium]MCP5498699.1 hypothetical protein [Leptospiraceae bacterium]
MEYRDFNHYKSCPILHRKETFLHSSHPRYEEFSALSSAEEAGLLSRRDIGSKNRWEEVLQEKGLRIEGHVLL